MTGLFPCPLIMLHGTRLHFAQAQGVSHEEIQPAGFSQNERIPRGGVRANERGRVRVQHGAREGQAQSRDHAHSSLR